MKWKELEKELREEEAKRGKSLWRKKQMMKKVNEGGSKWRKE